MMTRKKPWNRVDQSVYSISSTTNGGKQNMNICSYAVPVSMKPKRFIVAIYHNTLTLKNVKENPELLLQYLSEPQSNLVNLLGKKSGFKTDKLKRIAKITTSYNSFSYLTECNAFVHLKVVQWITGGDHDCVLCDVIAFKNLNDFKPLTLDYLRFKKIISA